jgi:hypothetical protein
MQEAEAQLASASSSMDKLDTVMFCLGLDDEDFEEEGYEGRGEAEDIALVHIRGVQGSWGRMLDLFEAAVMRRIGDAREEGDTRIQGEDQGKPESGE